MGRVVHFEIHCGDPDRAERFYRDVFGWDIQRYEGAPIDYRLITTGPDDQPGINGALVQRRGEIDGSAVIAYVNTISVEDIDEAERRLAAAGGEVALPRAEVPGVGQLAYYKDTEGNIFGILQPA
jgi:predicted enzyme related to lactoylglutathione lyase